MVTNNGTAPPTQDNRTDWDIPAERTYLAIQEVAGAWIVSLCVEGGGRGIALIGATCETRDDAVESVEKLISQFNGENES